MNDFEVIFNNLDDIDKKAINAYRSGREFKNMATNIMIWINNKPKPVIIPSIVDNALACELFLKSMIIMNTKKLVKEHSLKKLIYEADICLELKNEFKECELDLEIEKIDKAFIEWRYVYERDEIIINNGFLNKLSDALEEISRDKILRKYNLNMLESFI